MYRDLKIRNKILIGFLVFVLVIPVVGYIGVYGSQKISRSFKVTADSSTPSIQALLEIKSTANAIEAQIVGFELFGELGEVEDRRLREEGSLVGDRKYALIASVEKIDRWLDQYRRHMIPGQEHNKLRFIDAIEEKQLEVINAAFDVFELKERGKSSPELMVPRSRLKGAQKDLRETIAAAIENELDVIKKRNDKADDISETAVKIIVAVSAGTFLIVVIVGYMLSLSISRPIRSLTELVDKLALDSDDPGDNPINASKDEVGQLARAFQDMTKRLKVTTVSRNELALEVAQRRQAEEQLERHAQELGRSNEELQQFAYVAAHQLQQPLRTVASYTQLLSRRYQGKLDSAADEFIDYAVDGASHMKTLLDDLLRYSQIGQLHLDFQATDCEVVLGRALATLRTTLEDTGGVVTHDPLPSVMAAGSQLGQVFQNLIGNALKYWSDQPPGVHVAARQIDGNWQFSIKDNGIGIDPQYADRIFTIFQRLHKREEYSGTGIGLAICKKIVERHGGQIWVESAVGKGSTFFFTIPV